MKKTPIKPDTFFLYIHNTGVPSGYAEYARAYGHRADVLRHWFTICLPSLSYNKQMLFSNFTRRWMQHVHFCTTCIGVGDLLEETDGDVPHENNQPLQENADFHFFFSSWSTSGSSLLYSGKCNEQIQKTLMYIFQLLNWCRFIFFVYNS